MFVEWSEIAVQIDLHCNASYSGHHCASADRFPSLALAEHAAEVEGDSGHFLKLTSVQIQRHSVRLAVGLPLGPYFCLSVESCLHLAIDNPCVSSSCITFMTTPFTGGCLSKYSGPSVEKLY